MQESGWQGVDGHWRREQILKSHRVIVMLVMIVFLSLMSPVNGEYSTSYPPEQVPAVSTTTESFVAVQLFDLTCKTEADFDRFFLNLRQQGVTTVLMRVFQGDGVFFATTAAPVIKDLLLPACAAAERQEIDLYAWMTTRTSGWYVSANPDWQDRRYNLETGALETYNRLDLFNPQFRDSLTRLFRDLARYPVTGILFQDDFIMRHTEGFSESALAAASTTLGITVKPEELFLQTRREGKMIYVSRYGQSFYRWRQWKIDSILSLQEAIMEACRRINPKLRFALNCYYETLTSPESGRSWYAQDVQRAARLPFDLFSFMAYQAQISQETGQSRRRVLSTLTEMTKTARKLIGSDHRILMKIQARDWETGGELSAEDILQAVDAVLEGGSVNVALVPYRRSLPLTSITSLVSARSVNFKKERSEPTIHQKPDFPIQSLITRP